MKNWIKFLKQYLPPNIDKQEALINALKGLDQETNKTFIEAMNALLEIEQHLEQSLSMLSAMAMSVSSESNADYHYLSSQDLQEKGLFERLLSSSEFSQKKIGQLIHSSQYFVTVSGLKALESDIKFLNQILDRKPVTNIFEKIQDVMIHMVAASSNALSHLTFDIKEKFQLRKP